MQIAAATNLACPIDGLPLDAKGASLRCEMGHSFDRAREGYWNLLLVQQKTSRDPGDSKDMVMARRKFLDGGHFVPIGARLLSAVREIAAEQGSAGALNIVDAGCGEGYYLELLSRLAATCSDQGDLRLAGIDVSKWAVKAAARRKAQVAWLVANNRSPPFLAGTVDLLICLFGFPAWEGFKGVQKAGGWVLLVDPGIDHLIELREIIYPTVSRSGPPLLSKAKAAGYRLKREEALQFRIELTSGAMIQDLVAMTPHAHRLAALGREALAGCERLSMTADVVMRLLRLE
jgi:23S rRNA (guanine745-N1)-methyltransferase